MKKLLLISVFLTVVALPASAGVECQTYFDSRAYSDPVYNFCWLSGSICYQCVDVDRGSGCSSDWEACDPNPARIVPLQQIADCRPASTPAAPDSLVPRSRIERVTHLKIAHLL